MTLQFSRVEERLRSFEISSEEIFFRDGFRTSSADNFFLRTGVARLEDLGVAEVAPPAFARAAIGRGVETVVVGAMVSVTEAMVENCFSRSFFFC